MHITQIILKNISNRNKADLRKAFKTATETQKITSIKIKLRHKINYSDC